MKVFVLQWYGHFHNLDDIRDWESDNGDDTYLYIFRGKEECQEIYVLLWASILPVGRKENEKYISSRTRGY